MILNPIPGATRDKNDGGYPSDSGLDILVPVGTACVACADGELVYSEVGHTPWHEDTDYTRPGFQPPFSILLKLDEPFQAHGLTVRFAWYTHLTRIAHQVVDGGQPKRVRASDTIGWSGIGNRVPHLHFGLLSARTQREGEFLSDRQVADLVWPPKTSSTKQPPAPKKHTPAHRSKMFLNENRARGFKDGTETAALEICARLEPGGSCFVWIDGHQVNARSFTVDIAHE